MGTKKSKADYLELVCAIISLVLMAWIVLSFANVLAHNSTDHIYASWNFFTVFRK